MSLVVYDGDCGFCERSIHFVRSRLRADAQRAIEFARWQSLHLATHGLTTLQVSDAVRLVRPDGTHLAGAAVFGFLARHGRGAWPLLGCALRLPPASWAATCVYRLIAANRQRLPGTTKCTVPQSTSLYQSAAGDHI